MYKKVLVLHVMPKLNFLTKVMATRFKYDACIIICFSKHEKLTHLTVIAIRKKYRKAGIGQYLIAVSCHTSLLILDSTVFAICQETITYVLLQDQSLNLSVILYIKLIHVGTFSNRMIYI